MFCNQRSDLCYIKNKKFNKNLSTCVSQGKKLIQVKQQVYTFKYYFIMIKVWTFLPAGVDPTIKLEKLRKSFTSNVFESIYCEVTDTKIIKEYTISTTTNWFSYYQPLFRFEKTKKLKRMRKQGKKIQNLMTTPDITSYIDQVFRDWDRIVFHIVNRASLAHQHLCLLISLFTRISCHIPLRVNLVDVNDFLCPLK